MILDATDLILGRMATRVTKKAMQGEEVIILNAEKAVVTGQPKVVLANYKRMRDMGAPLFGPYYPRPPERIVKRTMRGMLPWAKTRGREAYKKIKCYVGVPEEYKSYKTETIEEANVHRTNSKYVTIKEISKHLGARQE